MIDYLDAIRTESARLSAVTRDTPASAPVPSCPGWNVSDLIWHLAEVQHFWASIVGDRLDSPEAVTPLARPDDDGLASVLAERSARLISVLESTDPGDTCWSWYEHGHNAGWVARRQAHEALIHRVDGELAVGDPSPIDEILADDGVDEILTTMLDATDLPDWSQFDSNDTSAVVTTPTRNWGMSLGRFRGTSPNTGNTYDEPALRLVPAPRAPSVMITGTAAGIDLWLWGRGGTNDLGVTGDLSLVDFIRAAAAAATQ